MNLQNLFDEFPPEVIHWRIGATTANKDRGMALAYIDARDVMDRLDAVCGPENWQCEYVDAGGGKMACRIGIHIPIERTNAEGEIITHIRLVWKADGAGETDVEGAKGAFSDAFKRAAVKWGIGRYLYDIDSPWVEIEQKGRSSKIKPHEYARLSQIPGNKQQGTFSPPTFDEMEGLIKEAESMDALAHVWKLNGPLLKTWDDITLKEITKIKDQRKAVLLDVESAP